MSFLKNFLGGEKMFVRSFKIENLEKWSDFQRLAKKLRVSRSYLIRKLIDFALKNPELVETIIEEGGEA